VAATAEAAGDGSGRYERREGRDFTYLHPHQRRSARGETG